MFERWLEKLLRKKVGEFLDGINKTNLKLALFHGNITISKSSIKPKAFQNLGIPGKMKFSWVENLFIKIPWKLFGDKPIVIEIEDVFALFESFEHETDVSEFVSEKAIRKRLKYINNLFTSSLKEKNHSRSKKYQR